MAVSEDLSAYSTVAGSNTPSGSDNVGPDLDNHLRDMKKNIRRAASHFVGATAPENVRGSLWADTSASPTVTLNYQDGSSLIPLFDIDESAGTSFPFNILGRDNEFSGTATFPTELNLDGFFAADPAELTISSGRISPSDSASFRYRIDTEGDTSTDTVTVIGATGVPVSALILLNPESTSRTAILQGNSNISLNDTSSGGTFVMDDADRHILLRRISATEWREVFRGGYADTTTPGHVRLATQAKMEAATDANSVVTPSVQHNHPGMPKAWARVTSAGALAQSYNVSDSTASATGIYRVFWDTDFAANDYATIATIIDDNTNERSIKVRLQAVGSVKIHTQNRDNAENNMAFSVVAFGDQ